MLANGSTFTAPSSNAVPRWLCAPPGVYRAQHDTHLIADALAEAALPVAARVLDLGSGSGALAIAAARLGAASVTAVDRSRSANVTTWVNTSVRRLPVRVRRGDLKVAVALGPFEVVISNPPYVPCDSGRDLASRRWDAGPEGRDLLNPLCDASFDLLEPGGFMLLVHSGFSGEEETLRRLRLAGTKAAVVARQMIPFGPVLRSRFSYLQSQGLCGSGDNYEELVVVRADKPQRNC